MEESTQLFPLLLVLLLAFLVPLLLSKFRVIPTVVGEILAGIVIGVSGLHLVNHSEFLDVFSNIGLAFLMFLAGMEIDLNRIMPASWSLTKEKKESKSQKTSSLPSSQTLGLAALNYFFTGLLAIPAAFLLRSIGLEGNPWLIAFVLSATSLGVLLPILKNRRLNETTTGQAIFFSAVLADFFTVILLTIFIIVLDRGLDVEIFSVVLLFLAFIFAAQILGRFFNIPWVRRIIEELSNVTVQIKVRGAIAILMLFVVLAGLLGVELILGAFLAGLIISLLKTRQDDDLIHKLEAFGFGFFIPIFFILAGAQLELGSLFDSPGHLALLPILLIVSYLIKLLPALLLRRLMPWRQVFASASLLNIHLSIEIAIAVIGERLGLLTPATSAAIVLFSVLTVVTMPLVFNWLMPPLPNPSRRSIVIFGFNELSLQVARVLRGHDERVFLVDSVMDSTASAEKIGVQAILAPDIPATLEHLEPGETKALLLLTGDDEFNLTLACQARDKGIHHIVAVANEPSRAEEFRQIGATPFTSTLYNHEFLALMARNADIFQLLTTTSDDQDIRQLTIRNPRAFSRPLRALELPPSLLVLAISRSGSLIVPHGNNHLEFDDRVTLLGNVAELEEAAWLAQSS